MSALVGNTLDLYFGGDMNASLALTGQVAGRIESVEPVADIIQRCAAECRALLGQLATRYAD
jgi:enoyl-[acyl-carrier protein] reductase II